MTQRRERLPEVPTGFECFDLLWSQLIPDAASYVAVLPRSVDPAWATEDGLRWVAASLVKKWVASDELQRTPTHSALFRMRRRQLDFLKSQYHGQALNLVGALVDQARKEHLEESPALLLTVARDAFKALLVVVFPIEDVSPSADGNTK